MLGHGKWGGAPVGAGAGTGKQELFVPSCPGPEPMRFSERARALGRMQEADELAKIEDIGMDLATRAAPSLFSVPRWRAVLEWARYPPETLEAVLEAMQVGVSIDPCPQEPLQPAIFSENHGSLYGHLPFVNEKLSRQLADGTLAPWPPGSMPHVVAPLGVVVKHKTYADGITFKAWERANVRRLAEAAAIDHAACLSDKRGATLRPELFVLPELPAATGAFSQRIIHDARFGINDRGEPPDMKKLDTLREIAHAARSGDFTWVEDVRGAFKLVQVLGWQTPLLGAAVLGMVFVDMRLTFGLNMSPFLFQAMVGHPLLWLAIFVLGSLRMAGRLFQYVDDHIGLARSHREAIRQRNVFYTVCNWLGIPLEAKKRKPPAQKNLMLGLILHTTDPVRIECPSDKLDWIREVLAHVASADTVTIQQLESVCGMIGFIGVSLRGALVFSAELRGALRRTKAAGSKFCTLTPQIQGDIRYWSDFAANWNGMEIICAECSIPKGHLAADAMCDKVKSAVGLFACGQGFRIELDRRIWEGGRWGESFSDIAILELIAYALLSVAAAALFCGDRPRMIPGVTDNSVVRQRIERGWCRDPHASAILRFVMLVATTARVECSMTWIASEENTLSDAPSRNAHDDFATALRCYYSHFPHGSEAPSWWPGDVRFGPRAGQSFTTCIPGSALRALAHNLGTTDITEVYHDAQQVDILLRSVRAEFGRPDAG